LHLSIASFFSRRSGGKETAKLELAATAFAEGRLADAATLYRELTTSGVAEAQLRLAQCYERGHGVLQSFVDAGTGSAR
jgi:TPR repeat protein